MSVNQASILLVTDVLAGERPAKYFLVDFTRLASTGTPLVFYYIFKNPLITSYLLQDAAGTGLTVQITFTCSTFGVVYPSSTT